MSFTADRLETPGTARLFDSTGQALSTHIHLIPAPSSSPEDPLNWTQPRKYFHLFCILLYTIATCVLSSVLYSVYTPLGDDNGLTLDQLNAGQGYMYLFIGLACLFTQPMALAYGKKPMYIASSLATGLVNLWVIYGKGNGQWIACRLLLGLALSPQFALVEVSIADVVCANDDGRTGRS
jgi:MFS family permease